MSAFPRLHSFAIVLTIFSLLTIFSKPLRAQAPEGINYQAIARDNNGNVLSNRMIEVRFSVLANSASGNLIYQETHGSSAIIETNDFGLFNLIIGGGNQIGGSATSFSEVDWGNSSYFLKVEVEVGNGFEDLGTTQLISVPYALYAKRSGNLIKAGEGIQVFNNDSISNTGDLSDQNELITSFRLEDDSLLIVNEGANADTVDVSVFKNSITNQDLGITFAGNQRIISITNGNQIQFSVADPDSSSTNEIQTLEVVDGGDSLQLSNTQGLTVSKIGVSQLNIPTSDNQNLVFRNDSIVIDRGAGVDLSGLATDAELARDTSFLNQRILGNTTSINLNTGNINANSQGIIDTSLSVRSALIDSTNNLKVLLNNIQDTDNQQISLAGKQLNLSGDVPSSVDLTSILGVDSLLGLTDTSFEVYNADGTRDTVELRGKNVVNLDNDPTNELIDSIKFNSRVLEIYQQGIVQSSLDFDTLFDGRRLALSSRINQNTGAIAFNRDSIGSVLDSLNKHINLDNDTSSDNERVDSLDLNGSFLRVFENGTLSDSVDLSPYLNSALDNQDLSYANDSILIENGAGIDAAFLATDAELSADSAVLANKIRTDSTVQAGRINTNITDITSNRQAVIDSSLASRSIALDSTLATRARLADTTSTLRALISTSGSDDQDLSYANDSILIENGAGIDAAFLATDAEVSADSAVLANKIRTDSTVQAGRINTNITDITTNRQAVIDSSLASRSIALDSTLATRARLADSVIAVNDRLADTSSTLRALISTSGSDDQDLSYANDSILIENGVGIDAAFLATDAELSADSAVLANKIRTDSTAQAGRLTATETATSDNATDIATNRQAVIDSSLASRSIALDSTLATRARLADSVIAINDRLADTSLTLRTLINNSGSDDQDLSYANDSILIENGVGIDAAFLATDAELTADSAVLANKIRTDSTAQAGRLTATETATSDNATDIATNRQAVIDSSLASRSIALDSTLATRARLADSVIAINDRLADTSLTLRTLINNSGSDDQDLSYANDSILIENGAGIDAAFLATDAELSADSAVLANKIRTDSTVQAGRINTNITDITSNRQAVIDSSLASRSIALDSTLATRARLADTSSTLRALISTSGSDDQDLSYANDSILIENGVGIDAAFLATDAELSADSAVLANKIRTDSTAQAGRLTATETATSDNATDIATNRQAVIDSSLASRSIALDSTLATRARLADSVIAINDRLADTSLTLRTLINNSGSDDQDLSYANDSILIENGAGIDAAFLATDAELSADSAVLANKIRTDSTVQAGRINTNITDITSNRQAVIDSSLASRSIALDSTLATRARLADTTSTLRALISTSGSDDQDLSYANDSILIENGVGIDAAFLATDAELTADSAVLANKIRTDSTAQAGRLTATETATSDNATDIATNRQAVIDSSLASRSIALDSTLATRARLADSVIAINDRLADTSLTLRTLINNSGSDDQDLSYANDSILIENGVGIDAAFLATDAELTADSAVLANKIRTDSTVQAGRINTNITDITSNRQAVIDSSLSSRSIALDSTLATRARLADTSSTLRGLIVNSNASTSQLEVRFETDSVLQDQDSIRLDNEIVNRTAADAALATKVQGDSIIQATRINTNITDIATNQQAIIDSSLASRSIALDSTLATRARLADTSSTLRGLIGNSNASTSQLEVRFETDSVLQDQDSIRLDNEISNRTAADAALATKVQGDSIIQATRINTNITDIATNRQAVIDSSLASRSIALDSTLATRARLADTSSTLRGLIGSSNASTSQLEVRFETDSVLQDQDSIRLDNEIVNRTAADAALATKVQGDSIVQANRLTATETATSDNATDIATNRQAVIDSSLASRSIALDSTLATRARLADTSSTLRGLIGNSNASTSQLEVRFETDSVLQDQDSIRLDNEIVNRTAADAALATKVQGDSIVQANRLTATETATSDNATDIATNRQAVIDSTLATRARLADTSSTLRGLIGSSNASTSQLEVRFETDSVLQDQDSIRLDNEIVNRTAADAALATKVQGDSIVQATRINTNITDIATNRQAIIDSSLSSRSISLDSTLATRARLADTSSTLRGLIGSSNASTSQLEVRFETDSVLQDQDSIRLDNEIVNRTAADAALATKVQGDSIVQATRINTNITDITANRQAIIDSSLASRSIALDSTLATRARLADTSSTLRGLIGSSNASTSQLEVRFETDSVLQDQDSIRLDNEISNRTAADAALATKVQGDSIVQANRLTATETATSDNATDIATNRQAVIDSTLATRARLADTSSTLRGLIGNSNASTSQLEVRFETDSVLQDQDSIRLDNEIVNRTAADAALATKVQGDSIVQATRINTNITDITANRQAIIDSSLSSRSISLDSTLATRARLADTSSTLRGLIGSSNASTSQLEVRFETDSVLQDQDSIRLDNEISNRTAADAALATKVQGDSIVQANRLTATETATSDNATDIATNRQAVIDSTLATRARLADTSSTLRGLIGSSNASTSQLEVRFETDSVLQDQDSIRLDNEIVNRTAADAALATKVQGDSIVQATRINTNITDITANRQAIIDSSLASRSIALDSTLATRARLADTSSTLRGLIGNSNASTSQLEVRFETDSVLQDQDSIRLDNEIANRTAADAALATKVQGDSIIQATRINTNITDIATNRQAVIDSTLATRARLADTSSTLRGLIGSSNASTSQLEVRFETDSVLQDQDSIRLDNEIVNRTAADAALATKVQGDSIVQANRLTATETATSDNATDIATNRQAVIDSTLATRARLADTSSTLRGLIGNSNASTSQLEVRFETDSVLQDQDSIRLDNEIVNRTAADAALATKVQGDSIVQANRLTATETATSDNATDIATNRQAVIDSSLASRSIALDSTLATRARLADTSSTLRGLIGSSNASTSQLEVRFETDSVLQDQDSIRLDNEIVNRTAADAALATKVQGDSIVQATRINTNITDIATNRQAVIDSSLASRSIALDSTLATRARLADTSSTLRGLIGNSNASTSQLEVRFETDSVLQDQDSIRLDNEIVNRTAADAALATKVQGDSIVQATRINTNITDIATNRQSVIDSSLASRSIALDSTLATRARLADTSSTLRGLIGSSNASTSQLEVRFETDSVLQDQDSIRLDNEIVNRTAADAALATKAQGDSIVQAGRINTNITDITTNRQAVIDSSLSSRSIALDSTLATRARLADTSLTLRALISTSGSDDQDLSYANDSILIENGAGIDAAFLATDAELTADSAVLANKIRTDSTAQAGRINTNITDITTNRQAIIDSSLASRSIALDSTLATRARLADTSSTLRGLISAAGDDLGNHTAATDIILNGNYIGNDGDPNEGIAISNDGSVGINTTPSTSSRFFINETILENGLSIIQQNNSATRAAIKGEIRGTNGSSAYALEGEATSSANDNFGLHAIATGAGINNYGVYGKAIGATNNWSAYFDEGNVFIRDTLFVPAGAVAGQVLTAENNSGKVIWSEVAGDNLGNHSLDSNLKINNFYISADGDDEGILINNDGRVAIGKPRSNGDGELFLVSDTVQATGTQYRNSAFVNVLGANSPNATQIALLSTVYGSDGFNIGLFGWGRGSSAGTSIGTSGRSDSSDINIGVNGFVNSSLANTSNEGVRGTVNGNALDNYGVFGSSDGINSNNNVGIYGNAENGATNWAGYFDNGNVFIQDTLVLSTGALAAGSILADVNGDGKASWQDPNNLLGNAFWSLNGNSGLDSSNFIGTTDAQDLIFRTDNAERMRIGPTGRVGINTTNPGGDFHVVDSNSSSTINLETMNLLSEARIDFITPVREWQMINHASLDIFQIFDRTSGSPRMTFNNSGQVGVGTTTPDSMLTIAGGINAEFIRLSGGNPATGQVLTAIDGNGKTSWQDPNSLITDSDNQILSINAAGDELSISDGNVLNIGRIRDSSLTDLADTANVLRGLVFANTSPFETTSNITSNENGDYATDDFVFGSPQLDDDGIVNHDNRMFFDKSKAAFRAGVTRSSQSDDAFLGFGSVAFGQDNTVSGDFSSAFGQSNTVSNFYSASFGVNNLVSGSAAYAFGQNNSANANSSVTFGERNIAQSYAEVVIGSYNDTVAPFVFSQFTSQPGDRAFVIGNGTIGNRSNALEVYKNGNATLYGQLTLSDGANPITFPNSDGNTDEILKTDGLGNLSFVPISNLITNTDNQTLSLNGTGGKLSILNGNTITLNDSSATNELQALSKTGSTVTLSNSGGTFVDSALTEAQVDAFVANNGFLTTEVDGSITNELQDLSINGANDSLLLSNGDGVSLSDITAGISDDQDLSYANDSILIENGAGIDAAFLATDAELTADSAVLANKIRTDSTAQATRINTNITDITANRQAVIDSSLASRSIALDSTLATRARLADTTSTLRALISTSGSDDQNLTLSAGGGTIDIESGNSIILNDSSATNELQSISKSGSTVTLSDGGGTFTDSALTETQVDDFVANNGFLTTEVDGSVTNELQDLSINGANDSLLLSNGDGVSLSDITAGISDDQDLSYANDSILIENGAGIDAAFLATDAEVSADSAVLANKIRTDSTAQATRINTNITDITTNRQAIIDSSLASRSIALDSTLATRARLADTTSTLRALISTSGSDDQDLSYANDSILIENGAGIDAAFLATDAEVSADSAVLANKIRTDSTAQATRINTNITDITTNRQAVIDSSLASRSIALDSTLATRARLADTTSTLRALISTSGSDDQDLSYANDSILIENGAGIDAAFLATDAEVSADSTALANKIRTDSTVQATRINTNITDITTNRQAIIDSSLASRSIALDSTLATRARLADTTSTLRALISTSGSDDQNLTLSAGGGTIDIESGNSIILNDSSATNELQSISKSGSTVTLSDGGGTFTDSALTETQVDDFVANNGFLTTEVDGSVTNELQDLSINGANDSLLLSNGDGVRLSDLQSATDTLNIIQANDTNYLKVQNGTLEFVEDNDIAFQFNKGKISVENSGSSVYLGEFSGDSDNLLSDKFNVGIGQASLRANSAGNRLTAVGVDALRSINSGANNTALGFFSGVDLASGSDNVFLGNFSGGIISEGSRNVFIGARAGLDASSSFSTIDGAIKIGFEAGIQDTTDNTLFIENSNSLTPLIYGDFANDSLKVFGTLSVGNAFTLPTTNGTVGQIMQANNDGTVTWVNPNTGTDSQTLSINAAGDELSISGGNTLNIGRIRDSSLTDISDTATAIRSLISLAASPWLTGTNTIFTTTDDVGIGTNTPFARLHLESTSGRSLFIDNQETGVSFSTAMQVNSIGAPNGGNTGIQAEAANGSIHNIAINLNARGSSSVEYGVQAFARDSASGVAYGGRFDAQSDDGTSYGVEALATSVNGASTAFGLRSEASGTGNENYGIYATAAGAGTNYAAWFDQGDVRVGDRMAIGGAVQTNRKLYVSSSADQYAGQFVNTISGATNTSFGVDGTSSGSNPGGTNIGVKGAASGSGFNVGVQGLGSGSGANSYSGYFILGKFYVGDSTGIGEANPTAPLDVLGKATIDTLDINNQYTFPSDAPNNSGDVIQFNGTEVVWDQPANTGNEPAFTFDNVNQSIFTDSVSFDFVVGSTSLDNLGGTDDDTRMYFHKGTASFRVGTASGSDWNVSSLDTGTSVLGGVGNNVTSNFATVAGGINNTAGARWSFVGSGDGNSTSGGGYSVVVGGDGNTASDWNAFVGGGQLNIASGLTSSVLGGLRNVAAGNFSSVLGGADNTAFSTYETVLGTNSTNYTPNSTNSFSSADRMFTIGNGINTVNRSDALIIYKSGDAILNGQLTLSTGPGGDSLTFPNTDGTDGQVLKTDGSGNLTWEDVSAASTCPTGMLEAGPKMCIDSTNRTVNTWFVAATSCTTLGYKLPTWAEWYSGVSIATGIADTTDDWEWVDGGTSNTVRKVGNGGIENTANDTPTNNVDVTFRCVTYR